MVIFVVKSSGEGTSDNYENARNHIKDGEGFECVRRKGEGSGMARHGENIRKRADGRWEGRYKTYSEEKGKDVYRSVYGCTYAVVKEKLMAAKMTPQKNLLFRECAGGERMEVSCANVTFSEAAVEWLEEKREKCKYSTYIKYESVYRVHLSASLGTDLLSEFKPEISDHIFLEKYSESLQRSICCVMNQIIRHVNRKYGLQIPILQRPAIKMKKAMETFTNSERLRLFSSIYDAPDKYGTAIILCLYTGLRIGELCALRWKDIGFKEMTLAVERTVQRIAVKDQNTKKGVKTCLMETEPKSESSKRIIPISAEIVKLLSNLDMDKPYVFGGDKPAEPRTLQYRFKKILAAANVGERNFHMLRHTFATSCIESGMDVKSLCELLGHSDVKITMNRYVHPTMDSKRKQLETLSGFYGQIHGQAA